VKKLVRFIKMCLKYGYGNMSDNFLCRMVRNKQKLYHYDSSILLYVMRKVHGNQEGMKLIGSHQLMGYAIDVH
jgi:hypothetical protein